MSERRSEGFWYGHVEAWRESGQARVEYCTRHGLNLKSFGRWLNKARCAQAAADSRLRLVPVSPLPSAVRSPIQLHSPSGWRIELGCNTLDELAHLLRQLP